jgi:hypothetical protein
MVNFKAYSKAKVCLEVLFELVAASMEQAEAKVHNHLFVALLFWVVCVSSVQYV